MIITIAVVVMAHPPALSMKTIGFFLNYYNPRIKKIFFVNKVCSMNTLENAPDNFEKAACRIQHLAGSLIISWQTTTIKTVSIKKTTSVAISIPPLHRSLSMAAQRIHSKLLSLMYLYHIIMCFSFFSLIRRTPDNKK